jgi:hypothetical protein
MSEEVDLAIKSERVRIWEDAVYQAELADPYERYSTVRNDIVVRLRRRLEEARQELEKVA